MIDRDALRKRVQRHLAEQRVLVQALLRLKEQVQGSLFARYGECGKEVCVCREGQRHGPYYVLSTRSGGQGAYAYLEGRTLDTARDLVERHREFRRGFRRLKKLNAELVELLRRYQETTAKEGVRRLGIGVERAARR
jgi:hypothetical protein